MNAAPDDELTLAATREDLRKALGSRRRPRVVSRHRDAMNRDPDAMQDDPQFPRSKLMRALLSEDLRWVWVAGATALTAVAGRRLRTTAQLGRWIGAYSLVRRVLDRTRSH
jgi:hypothetical protein